jgi:lysyl-tRNA synthetase class 2
MNKKHPTITMNPCESGQIKAHGYDAATSTLAVEFKHGGIYLYHGVPASVHASMSKAESVGKFLHAHVKGTYDFKKVS